MVKVESLGLRLVASSMIEISQPSPEPLQIVKVLRLLPFVQLKS